MSAIVTSSSAKPRFLHLYTKDGGLRDPEGPPITAACSLCSWFPGLCASVTHGEPRDVGRVLFALGSTDEARARNGDVSRHDGVTG